MTEASGTGGGSRAGMERTIVQRSMRTRSSGRGAR